ncbi:hypothetical protein D3C85_781230 [compost metagenome]
MPLGGGLTLVIPASGLKVSGSIGASERLDDFQQCGIKGRAVFRHRPPAPEAQPDPPLRPLMRRFLRRPAPRP